MYGLPVVSQAHSVWSVAPESVEWPLPHSLNERPVTPIAARKRPGRFPSLSDIPPPAYSTAMRDIQNIVILTGAGVSAESGLPTFRSSNGVTYWDVYESDLVPKSYRVEDVCTPQALAADPGLVHRFYDLRRAALTGVEPNAAHRALARLDAAWKGELLIVTQNVDDLHERAGATRMLHMHGELLSALCAVCGAREPWVGALPAGSVCGACGSAALRPDIVFFGEMPYQMERIEAALAKADLFVSIGTSGAVYPAAGFVQTAAYHGARTLELNLDPSMGSVFFEETRIGAAGVLVPDWVEEVLA
jgi:NAD-dependent deacetylase